MPARTNDMKLVAAVAAASSLLQVAFLRGLMAVGGGNELILGALLCGYLLFIAAGARLWQFLRHPSNPLVLLIIFAAASILELALLREIGILFKAIAHISGLTWIAGESVPIRPALWAAFLIGAPTSIATGMLFPLAVSRSNDPGAVGRFYAAEAFGHVVGFLGVALALWLGASDVSVIVFTPVVALAGFPLRTKLHAPVLAAVSAALLLTIAPLERATGDRGGLLPGKPFAVKSSPFRETAVIGTPEEYTIYSDSRAVVSYPPADIYAATRLAGLMFPSKTLLAADIDNSDIVFISEDPFVHSTLASSPAVKQFLHIYVFCVDPAALVFTSKAWEKAAFRSLAHRPIFMFGDPLASINNLRRANVALLILDLPDPLSVSDNRYFTVEFQRAVARCLAAGGIAVERYSLPAGDTSGLAKPLVVQTFCTLKSAFAQVIPFDNDSGIIFFATNDTKPLLERIDSAGSAAESMPDLESRVAARWLRLPRHAELRSFLASAAPVAPDTLRHPTTFLKRLTIENAFDRPESYRKAPSAGRFIIPAVIALLPLLVLGLAVFGIAKTRPKILISLDAFSAGILSMGAEIVLLFAYQAARGMLYLFTAAAVAAFMAGFWHGSASASRLGTSAIRRLKISIWLPLAAAILCFAFVLILPTTPIAAEIVLVIIMLATGYACGNNLSLLPSAVSDEPAASGAIVNASDNFGAALGAAGVTLVLIPLVGLPLAIGYLVSLKFVTAFALSFRK